MLRITNDFAASSSERGFKYQWLKKRSNGFRKLWQNFINIVVPWRVINLFSFIFYLLIILLTLYGSVQCSKANQFKSKGWLFAFDLPRSWTTKYFFLCVWRTRLKWDLLSSFLYLTGWCCVFFLWVLSTRFLNSWLMYIFRDESLIFYTMSFPVFPNVRAQGNM